MPKRPTLPQALRSAALAYPGAKEEFPWGDVVVKVDGKIFVFLPDADPAATPRLTLKLPHSAQAALALPGAEPIGYGLGRAGWVTLRLRDLGLALAL